MCAAASIHALSTKKHTTNVSNIAIINSTLTAYPHKYNVFKGTLHFSHNSLKFDIKQKNKYKAESVRTFFNTSSPFHNMNIEKHPKVGIIESSNGCISHAVGICNNWIFDTNLQHALKVTKSNLDWCASSTTENASFKKFDAGYIYIKEINTCHTRV
jgi:hypothetical protein